MIWTFAMLGEVGSFSSSTFATNLTACPEVGLFAECDTSSICGGKFPPGVLGAPRQNLFLRPSAQGGKSCTQEPKVAVPGGWKKKVSITLSLGTGATPAPSGNLPKETSGESGGSHTWSISCRLPSSPTGPQRLMGSLPPLSISKLAWGSHSSWVALPSQKMTRKSCAAMVTWFRKV